MWFASFPPTSPCATLHVQLRLKASDPKTRLYITCFNKRICDRQREHQAKSQRYLVHVMLSWNLCNNQVLQAGAP